LLRDILRNGEQVAAALSVIRAADADVLLLTGVDIDPEGATISALTEVLAREGAPYPYHFTATTNAGIRTGLDLDGDGRLGEPEDAQGYGAFPGQGSMAVLSRYPIGQVVELTGQLWRDLPEADPWFASPEAAAVQRVSSVAHWDVPVETPSGRYTCWPSPPHRRSLTGRRTATGGGPRMNCEYGSDISREGWAARRTGLRWCSGTSMSIRWMERGGVRS